MKVKGGGGYERQKAVKEGEDVAPLRLNVLPKLI